MRFSIIESDKLASPETKERLELVINTLLNLGYSQIENGDESAQILIGYKFQVFYGGMSFTIDKYGELDFEGGIDEEMIMSKDMVIKSDERYYKCSAISQSVLDIGMNCSNEKLIEIVLGLTELMRPSQILERINEMDERNKHLEADSKAWLERKEAEKLEASPLYKMVEKLTDKVNDLTKIVEGANK